MEKTNEILFRASGVGALMTQKQGWSFTATMKKKLENYTAKLKAGEPLTPNQSEEYKNLKQRRDNPPMSDTATQFIGETWLAKERGFWKDLKTMPVKKGIWGEEDAITLMSEVDGRFYVKNEERKTKGHLTGLPDVVADIDGKKVIIDAKSSWDTDTFIRFKPSLNYEWQGRVYMHLFDADEFWLRACLIDCPPHLYEQQKWYLRRDFDILDDDNPETLPLFEQLERNLIYSTNPQYTKEERVKTIKFERDDEIFATLMKKIPGAVEYYKNFKLNQVNA